MKQLKYRNQPTVVDGIRFSSKLEAGRYAELRLLQQGHVITGLVLQPRYPLHVNEKLVTTYVADFEYLEKGVTVTEDAKGVETPEFIIKRNLFEALKSRRILLTKKRRR